MGKDYKKYETSYIGGVNPEIQKNQKGLKSTPHNKELDQHRRSSSKKKSK